MPLEIAVKRYLSLGFDVAFLKPQSKLLETSLRTILDEHVPEQEIQETIEQAIEKGCGVALHMGGIFNGRYIFALDFDDLELYEWWKISHPDFANTPVQQTPNGVHILLTFSYPIHNAKSEKVDVISNGWYIAVEPSVHPSGQSYKWIIPPWHVQPIPVDVVQPNPSAEESIFHFPDINLLWDADLYGEEIEDWEDY